MIAGIQGRKSENLLKIDWSNKKVTDLYKMDIQNKLILINGTDEFMKEANKIISNRSENCEILNCYEIMQGGSKLQEILDNHDKVVETSGEKYPEEVFTGYTQKVTVS